MAPPKVSVIIPNYNHARFLPQRFASVLNQTRQDFELIFLDDASTDESRDIFAQLPGDPRIRAIFNTTNSGNTFVQWNRGAGEAWGDYLWFAESDDYAEPQLLEELTARLEENPGVGVAHCASMWVDTEGTVGRGGWHKHARWQKDFIGRGNEECVRLLSGNTIPNASAALVRRNLFERIGGANEDMVLCGDWMVWAKILAISNMAYVARPLNFFRHHDLTVRAKLMHSLQYVFERYLVVSFILDHCAVTETVREACLERMFKLWMTLAAEDPQADQWHNRINDLARRVDVKLGHRQGLVTVR